MFEIKNPYIEYCGNYLTKKSELSFTKELNYFSDLIGL